MENRTQRSEQTRNMVILAMFTAIIILLSFTPIGFIDLPFIKATIVHVPVIIGSILLGPRNGAFLGGVFGVCSLIKNTMAPSVLSFCFSPLIPVPGTERGSLLALVICLIPRILVGVTPWAVYALLKKLLRRKNTGIKAVELVIAGVVGAATNTALVMGLIFVLFKDAYAVAKEIPADEVLAAVMAVVTTNGVMEAVAAAVITAAVTLPLLKLLGKDQPAEQPKQA